MLSIGPNTLNIRDFNMKYIQSILNVICALQLANHAATLARNGKIKEAQSFYR